MVHLFLRINRQWCEAHPPWYTQTGHSGPHMSTNNIYVHLEVCTTVVYVLWLPPLCTPSALVSWYSGWVLPKWTCLLTASDKLSGPLISITTSLACSACMVDSALNCRGFCYVLILCSDDVKACVVELSLFMMGQLINNYYCSSYSTEVLNPTPQNCYHKLTCITCWSGIF